MARRLLPLLILLCAVLVAPATAGAVTDLHRQSSGADEPRTGKEALRQAKAALQGKGVDSGREVSPALRSLAEKLPELSGADRRRAKRLLARPTSEAEANPNESTYTTSPVLRHCGPHFCVHYVATTDDAPSLASTDGDTIPDYVETMLAEFEHTYRVENGTLGWAPPKADFNRGGDNRTDVYIKNIGPEGIFGYAAPDAEQPLNQGRNKLAAYLVMDDDYRQQEFRNYPRFIDPLRVTAAHEYNHVLQFNYDALQDNWMFESTAVWMEDVVYDDVNDYRNYLGGWAGLSLAPLTRFDQDPREDNPNNTKAYGDVVFVRWIDEHYGAETIRRAWEQSVATDSFAPGAYEAALPDSTSVFDVFARFAADTAEWRLARGAFEEGNTFPDMVRALDGDTLDPQNVTRERNDYVEGSIDHLSYALFNVDPQGQNEITLGATIRRGVKGAVALVGRTGDDRNGTYTVQITRLPRGGVGRVKLTNVRSYTRVTAILLNGDTRKSGYSNDIGDWLWVNDDEAITLAVNDFTRPRARRFAPRRGARRANPRTAIKIVFNEGVAGATPRNIKITGPRRKRVRFDVTQSSDGRTLRLKPRRRLARNKRYTVTLANAVTDGGGNRLRASQRKLRFKTRR